MLFKYYVWRSFKRDTTCEIVYAYNISQARHNYAKARGLHRREVEAERAHCAYDDHADANNQRLPER